MKCNVIYELLRSDGSIVSNKALRHSIGIHETDLYSELLSRYFYFESRNQLTNDGYFFNTIEDLECATALSEKQQRLAIKNLKSLGLIDYVKRGMPAKRYFKIIFDTELISKYIHEGKEIQQLRKKVSTITEEKEEQVSQKGKGNNTNIIIQKEEYKDNDNGALENARYFVFENKEIVNAINTYMNDLYKQRTGKIHPKLKPEQYRRIYQAICDYVDDAGYDYLIELMCKFLNSKIRTDYNINHFATEGILVNRVYEVAY